MTQLFDRILGVEWLGCYNTKNEKIVWIKRTNRNRFLFSWLNPINWVMKPIMSFSHWLYWDVTNKWFTPFADVE